MGQIANLTGGPGVAFIDVSGTLTELGHTKGGIRAELGEPIFMDLTTDVTGDTVVRRIKNGAQPDFLTIPFAEDTYDTLQNIVDGMTLVTDSVDNTKKRLERRVSAGGAPAEIKLVIKPIDPSTGLVYTSKAKWLTIPKAIAVGSVEITYATGEQRVFNGRFQALPEELAANAGYRTFYFGDGTAVGA